QRRRYVARYASCRELTETAPWPSAGNTRVDVSSRTALVNLAGSVSVKGPSRIAVPRVGMCIHALPTAPAAAIGRTVYQGQHLLPCLDVDVATGHGDPLTDAWRCQAPRSRVTELDATG